MKNWFSTGGTFTKNVMHACGHDAHTAILLCLAEAFSANRDLIKRGSIRFLFQQAEEVMPGGASYLVKDGVMKDVDRIFGLHISNMYETGTIACTCGPTLAATLCICYGERSRLALWNRLFACFNRRQQSKSKVCFLPAAKAGYSWMG